MHTEPTFAEVLVKFGSSAERAAAERHPSIKRIKARKNAKIVAIFKLLSRFFGFLLSLA